MSLRSIWQRLTSDARLNRAKGIAVLLLLAAGLALWSPLRRQWSSALTVPSVAALPTRARSDAPSQRIPDETQREVALRPGPHPQNLQDPLAAGEMNRPQPDPDDQTSPGSIQRTHHQTVQSNSSVHAAFVWRHGTLEPSLAGKFVLNSTLVGAQRRAASINNKLYYEGRDFEIDGETFTLTSVSAGRAVITQGDVVFELILARRPASPEPDTEPSTSTDSTE